MAEYSVVIEILWDIALHGIMCLEVRINSHLVVSHINGDYQVRHPTLLCQFLRVRLLKIHFNHIIYKHIPRNQNTITDSYANYILDWNLSHIL